MFDYLHFRISEIKDRPKRCYSKSGRTSDFEGQAPPANRISDSRARKPARFLRWSLDCRLHQASETGTGQGHREDSQRNPARRHQNFSGKQSTVPASHPRPAIRAEVLNTLRHRSYGFRVSPRSPVALPSAFSRQGTELCYCKRVRC